MPQTEKELRELVIETYTVPNFRDTCTRCGRGANELPVPTQEDMDALYELIDGYDMYRRRFTPEFEERIKRGKYVLGYLNSMRAGVHRG